MTCHVSVQSRRRPRTRLNRHGSDLSARGGAVSIDMTASTSPGGTTSAAAGLSVQLSPGSAGTQRNLTEGPANPVQAARFQVCGCVIYAMIEIACRRAISDIHGAHAIGLHLLLIFRPCCSSPSIGHTMLPQSDLLRWRHLLCPVHTAPATAVSGWLQAPPPPRRPPELLRVSVGC